jgi:DNA invertase Pin-like site-specific DNA recombinase
MIDHPTVTAVLAMVASGATWEAAANEFGLHTATVRRVAREAGVARPPKQRGAISPELRRSIELRLAAGVPQREIMRVLHIGERKVHAVRDAMASRGREVG